MIIGHPPPESQSLRDRLRNRLDYLDDLLQGGLDDYVSTDNPESWQACKVQIQQYILQVERLIAALSQESGEAPDRVLMDIPVSVIDEESGTTESFTVVGPSEADPSAGLISFLSPLGSALLLKHAEETVVVEAPGGRFVYRVTVIGESAPDAH